MHERMARPRTRIKTYTTVWGSRSLKMCFKAGTELFLPTARPRQAWAYPVMRPRLLTETCMRAGKTHTLMGNPSEPGLMILAIGDLFSMCQGNPNIEFIARMSYVEIYNEEVAFQRGPMYAQLPSRRRAFFQVRDLLDPDAKETGGLQVVEDPKTGPYVKGAIDKV